MKNSIETVRQRFLDYGDRQAVYRKGKYLTYRELYNNIEKWRQRLHEMDIREGSVCGILGDFSPEIAALFFALMEEKCILVPFTKEIKEIDTFKEIAGVEGMFTFDEEDHYQWEAYRAQTKKPLIQKQVDAGRSGLVVFSSGSTGKPKGILQDCERVMHKFVTERQGWKTVLFLMMDHFGGFNTFLGSLANGGLAVCIEERTPDAVCRAIEATKADLLPTTPTFLNLLIASRCYKQYDVSSLRLITYGTEMMNSTTLAKLQQIFPNAALKQTYGLSELGVLRSRSKEDGSLWLKVGGGEFETKIVDNILWIRAESNMVGYLNAPNPFDADGWFCTGDEVEQDGDYIRFVGRETDIINVGGQKVFPAEVEAVLLEDENVVEAAVYGKKHPLMGQIVAAKITLAKPEELKDVNIRLRKHCNERLAKYKVPVKIEIMDASAQHNIRFKKIRG